MPVVGYNETRGGFLGKIFGLELNALFLITVFSGILGLLTYILFKTLNMLFKNSFLYNSLKNHGVNYPTTVTFLYAWGIGSLLGLFLIIQMVTGVFLAMHYTPHIDYAFWSVEHIMCDVPNGWFVRYAHSNGSSMLFILLYAHIAKGLFYQSYKAHFARFFLVTQPLISGWKGYNTKANLTVQIQLYMRSVPLLFVAGGKEPTSRGWVTRFVDVFNWVIDLEFNLLVLIPLSLSLLSILTFIAFKRGKHYAFILFNTLSLAVIFTVIAYAATVFLVGFYSKNLAITFCAIITLLPIFIFTCCIYKIKKGGGFCRFWYTDLTYNPLLVEVTLWVVRIALWTAVPFFIGEVYFDPAVFCEGINKWSPIPPEYPESFEHPDKKPLPYPEANRSGLRSMFDPEWKKTANRNNWRTNDSLDYEAKERRRIINANYKRSKYDFPACIFMLENLPKKYPNHEDLMAQAKKLQDWWNDIMIAVLKDGQPVKTRWWRYDLAEMQKWHKEYVKFKSLIYHTHVDFYGKPSLKEFHAVFNAYYHLLHKGEPIPSNLIPKPISWWKRFFG